MQKLNSTQAIRPMSIGRGRNALPLIVVKVPRPMMRR